MRRHYRREEKALACILQMGDVGCGRMGYSVEGGATNIFGLRGVISTPSKQRMEEKMSQGDGPDYSLMTIKEQGEGVNRKIPKLCKKPDQLQQQGHIKLLLLLDLILVREKDGLELFQAILRKQLRRKTWESARMVLILQDPRISSMELINADRKSRTLLHVHI